MKKIFETDTFASTREAIARRQLLMGGAVVGAVAVMAGRSSAAVSLSLSEAQWRSRLSSTQFAVLRQGATERPFSSALDHEARQGLFACAGCGTKLFTSRTKFDSHTGWPSFWRPLAGAVTEREDRSAGMTRTEVLCRRCNGHLGHVFHDGPPPTGLRYCMNGAALTFRPGKA